MKVMCDAVTRRGGMCSCKARKRISDNNSGRSVALCGTHIHTFKEYIEEFSVDEAMDRILDGIFREYLVSSH